MKKIIFVLALILTGNAFGDYLDDTLEKCEKKCKNKEGYHCAGLADQYTTETIGYECRPNDDE